MATDLSVLSADERRHIYEEERARITADKYYRVHKGWFLALGIIVLLLVIGAACKHMHYAKAFRDRAYAPNGQSYSQQLPSQQHKMQRGQGMGGMGNASEFAPCGRAIDGGAQANDGWMLEEPMPPFMN